ncbi:hypothetical protein ZIOFF_020746 [Zingiber officinale]|uniref:Uncharacterized protein n=2 Tax=Zingiber officinale TaxID=94328 RepID=A0A8J5GZB1_ZINOF|nr:hypothetical protein ZIOFF_020746 [Zingiber officinale]
MLLPRHTDSSGLPRDSCRIAQSDDCGLRITINEMWPPLSAFEGGGAPANSGPLPRRSFYLDSGGSSDGNQASPYLPSFSSVPFSWERRPGIPKAAVAAAAASGPLLRLPPGTAGYHRKRTASDAAGDEDPFAVALAECAKRPPGPSIEELFTRTRSASAPRKRAAPQSAAWSISDRLGLHAASCKATCAIADSAVCVPRRPGPRGGTALPYALSSRRAG